MEAVIGGHVTIEASVSFALQDLVLINLAGGMGQHWPLQAREYLAFASLPPFLLVSSFLPLSPLPVLTGT